MTRPISIRYLSARDDETCLLWHRGLSTSDIALGAAMLEKADRRGIGHSLP